MGHPWQVMGTPWPTLNYQWYVCDTAAATADPVANTLLRTPTCATATGLGSNGSATRAGGANDYDLGAHRFSYVVPSAAAGKFLTFTATLTNAATTAQGAAFTFTQSRTMNSGIIQTTPGITGSPASTPEITGTPQVGKKLTAQALTATLVNLNSTGKITYQWQRGDSLSGSYTSISGATSRYYTPVSGDQDKYLRVVATATNNATVADTTTATTATPVQINYLIPNFSLSLGTTPATVIGQTLSATITGITGYPATYTYSYQWQRCTTASTGCGTVATSPTYTLTSADRGKYLRVNVRATNAAGTSSWVTSSNSAGPITR